MNKNFILCVDDDLTLLNALRSLLTGELGRHCWVEIAEGGEEALEVAAELRERGQSLAIVISDYFMPGMRGDQLLTEVHLRWPDSFKILLSGQCEAEGLRHAMDDANLYRFIEKPYDNHELVRTARTALHAFQGASAG